MSLIKGIPVVLKVREKIGEDAFHIPVYNQHTVTINDVLVTPLSSEDIAEDLAYYKKRTVYELCIPKGDNHDWTNSTVNFYGRDWIAVGEPREYIESNVPLRWNKKIRVAAYGNT